MARALEIADPPGLHQAELPLRHPPARSADRTTSSARLAENLAYAAEQAQAAGVRQLVEPLNRYDAPGFMLGTTGDVVAMLDRVGHPNLFLQFDVYHCQRVEGNLVETFRLHQPRIAHVQIADSPARHEPGTGEINYPFVFAALDEAGYDGWVSLEYRPRAAPKHRWAG